MAENKDCLLLQCQSTVAWACVVLTRRTIKCCNKTAPSLPGRPPSSPLSPSSLPCLFTARIPLKMPQLDPHWMVLREQGKCHYHRNLLESSRTKAAGFASCWREAPEWILKINAWFFFLISQNHRGNITLLNLWKVRVQNRKLCLRNR